ncbi:hypothetical protein [Staphylococcus marylandisciuri]|uniref:hypothetical protein n=1 Tax=Staphylococcus marylandisciuri TaxID=2981529 RepID=UPI0021CE3EDC|nr:hypothetical protein [Staphylococcus marylandisciuri]
MGPQHRETGKPVSTSNASWGGPTQRERDRNLFIQIRFLSRSPLNLTHQSYLLGDIRAELIKAFCTLI